MQAVEDHIAETGKLPSTTDILERCTLGSTKGRRGLEDLVLSGKLVVAYEAPKNPTIYLPEYMYGSLLRRQREPEWIDEFSFEEASRIKAQIRDGEDKLSQFHRLQSLLYGTGKLLEDAVAEALGLMEFRDLVTPYEDPDSWDFSFTYNETTYVLEVKGKSKWADKGDAAQLQQWLEKYIDDNPGHDPDKLQGVLVVNHFREIHPSNRWPKKDKRPPLSEAGEKYLKLGRRQFMTTIAIFDISERLVLGKITTEESRKEFIRALRRGLTQ